MLIMGKVKVKWCSKAKTLLHYFIKNGEMNV